MAHGHTQSKDKHFSLVTNVKPHNVLAATCASSLCHYIPKSKSHLFTFLVLFYISFYSSSQLFVSCSQFCLCFSFLFFILLLCVCCVVCCVIGMPHFVGLLTATVWTLFSAWSNIITLYLVFYFIRFCFLSRRRSSLCPRRFCPRHQPVLWNVVCGAE